MYVQDGLTASQPDAAWPCVPRWGAARTRNTSLATAAPQATYSRSALLIAAGLRLMVGRGAQRKQTSDTSAASAPGHEAWMPRSCRSTCMVAASTSYAAQRGAEIG